MDQYHYLKRVFFCAFLAFWGLTLPATAQTTANGGRSAFDFLSISPVSRAMGVGEAYIALGDDVGSIYYNPAGLASILTNEFDLTYMSLYQGLNYEYMSFASPLGQSFPSVGGVVALSASFIQPGEMQRSNDQGQTIGTFSSGDNVFTLALAKDISPAVHVGISVKLIQQQIDTIQNSLVDVDGGVVIIPPFNGMRIGIVLKNLGGQSDGYDLPLSLDAGLSYRRYELFSEQDDGSISLDTAFPIKPIEDPVGVRVGLEYNYKWVGTSATLRAGYKFLDTYLNGVGFTVGAGLGLDFGGTVLFLDYAYAPEDIFGDAHRVSLTTKF